MANDRDQGSKTTNSDDKQSGTPDRKRVIGEGMTSLDSTQVPLKAETGEPDWEAVKGGKPKSDAGDSDSSSRR
jgi:hypothetical protein